MGVARLEGQRCKTTGNTQPLRDFEKTRTSRPSPRKTSPTMRPDFLQSLKVRTNPYSKSGVETKRKDPGKSPSKFLNILQHELPKIREPFRKNHPAAKPVLHAQSKNPAENVPKAGLVGFFRKRLEEVRNTNSDKLEDSRPGTPSQGRRYLRPPSKISGQRRSGSLKDAMRDAEIAHASVDKHNPNALSSLEQETNFLRGNGTASQIENDAPDTESMSPIRKYVAELQKKNQQKRQAQFASGTNNTPVPSWRQAARVSSESNRLQHLRREEIMAVPIDIEEEELDLSAEMMAQDRKQKRAVLKSRKGAKVPQVELPSEDVSISDLSRIFRKKATQIIQCLEAMGEVPEEDDNYTVDVDMAEMIALEMDVRFLRPKSRAKLVSDHEQLLKRRKASDEEPESTESTSCQDLVPRPPVVCIMGHVDHGKTTLMDALRRHSQGKTKKNKSKKNKKAGKKFKTSVSGDVAGTEAGGITQVISAFQVTLDAEKKDVMTFLDTPGHAAFSSMRQSGSHAADIIVLVVAADDGVLPQTVEILNFYKSIVKEAAGGMAMVVAMNKIDKPGIDLEESKIMIENQLLEHGIVAEGVSADSKYGSPVQFIPISAKTGEGLEDLIEGLALQSEVMDLRADVGARAEGIVMDARIEQGLGVVVDCIVRWGSIAKGDGIVSDTCSGKVRILKDVSDIMLKKGLPSQPVRIVGFKTAPKAGDPLLCVASEQVADELVAKRVALKESIMSNNTPNDSNSFFSQVIISGRESMTSVGTERKLQRYSLDMEHSGPIRIPIVVKANGNGSLVAVRESLKMLSEESSFDISVDPIAEGVGVLTMGELEIARESEAAVFCFGVKNQDKAVVALAEASGVAIHEFDVIYSLLDHAKDVFTGYLPVTPFLTVHGRATVHTVFSINNDKDKVAGLKVTAGHIYKSFADTDKALPVYFRVVRDGEVVTPSGVEARATSLKKYKEDVESVRLGDECGLSLPDMVQFEEGDTIECFSLEMKRVFSK